MAQLRYEVAGEEHTIRLEANLRIGRGQENGLALANDQAVSGRHALIRLADDAFVLEDLDSRNGTFLERSGKRQRVAMPTELRTGDVISVGSIRLTFEVTETPANTEIFDARLTNIPGQTVVGRGLPYQGEPAEPASSDSRRPPRRDLLLVLAACAATAVLVVVLALVLARVLG